MGLLERMLPTAVSPFGQALDPETIAALRSQALIDFGSSMLQSGAGPAPFGQRPGFLASLGRGVQDMNWPGRVAQAGEQAMKMSAGAGQEAVQRILAENAAPPGADPHTQLAALRRAASALTALGTPDALSAAEQVSKLEKLYSEAVPAQGRIDWQPIVRDGKEFRIAIDPVTRKPVEDPDKPGEPWLLPQGAEAPPEITEAQRVQFENQLNSTALPYLVKYADLEGQFRTFLDAPKPSSPQAKAIWLRQAQNLIGAVTPSTPGESSTISALLGMIDKNLAKVGSGEALTPADMDQIVSMVKRMREANTTSGNRMLNSYSSQAKRMGFVSEILRGFQNVWGAKPLPAGAQELLNLPGGE